MRAPYSILDPKRKSLIRGTLLALASLWTSFHISGYPDPQPCPWLLLPLAATIAGAWDTARCLQKRWGFYHGGVLLLLYVDLMILVLILVFLLAPFTHFLL